MSQGDCRTDALRRQGTSGYDHNRLRLPRRDIRPSGSMSGTSKRKHGGASNAPANGWAGNLWPRVWRLASKLSSCRTAARNRRACPAIFYHNFPGLRRPTYLPQPCDPGTTRAVLGFQENLKLETAEEVIATACNSIPANSRASSTSASEWLIFECWMIRLRCHQSGWFPSSRKTTIETSSFLSVL